VKSKLILAAVIVLVFAGSYAARTRLERPNAGDGAEASRPPQRIVSMAPSITETLFCLGLGPRVVGVTRYCGYPPDALQKPRIGGHFDPNFEAIVRLKPDLVITLAGSEQDLPALEKLGLRTLVVRHKSVEGILESLTTIGGACGVEQAARHVVADLQSRITRVQEKMAGLARPRVLFCVERTLKAGAIEDAYIAGADGHIDRMIDLAAGRNPYQGRIRFPVVSGEGILRMNPEVIIDMVPRVTGTSLGKAAVAADWSSLARVDAVARGRVYVLDEDYVSVPGPRVILVVEKLARLIHPEVDWEGADRPNERQEG